MTPKELKRLSRSDLLEMLLDLSRENEKLGKENERLRTQLNDKNIAIENCGSLAEAALQLNGIFQAAEAACAQYTENIHTRSAELEIRCQQMEKETEERCQQMEKETRKRCQRMKKEAREACDVLLVQAKAQVQSCLDDAVKHRNTQNQEHFWRKDLMNGRKTE